MTLAEELLKAVQPFYTANDRKQHYPEDRQEGGVMLRFCRGTGCGWKPIDGFGLEHHGANGLRRRLCHICFRAFQAQRKRLY